MNAMGKELHGSLNVDVEDWFMGIEIDERSWGGFEDRLEIGLNRCLDLLDETGTRGTFFTLGYIARHRPDLVREIAVRGHELGTHGWSHRKIYALSPDQFRSELVDSIHALEDAGGQKIRTHRAPYFSITRDSLWAFPILRECGIEIDSSVYPGVNWRYGIPGAKREIHEMKDTGLIEFPVTLFECGPKRIGIGGAYLRILPTVISEYGMRQNLRAGRRLNLYMHPWEFDPDHPRYPIEPRIARLTHYFNLRSMERKVRALTKAFRFGTISETVDSWRKGRGEPSNP